MIAQLKLKRFYAFGLVGVLATGIQYAVLIALTRGGAMGPALASAIGFVVSAAVNYLCNYHFTFRSMQPHGVAAAKFMMLASVGLIINSAIMQGLVAAGLYYLIAQVFATGAVLLWNFIGNSLWTFGADSGTRGAAATDAALPMTKYVVRNQDLILLMVLVVVLRAAVCLLTDNQAGDADQRAILAAEWAHAPYWIWTGPWIPLHFYVTGILTWILRDPIVAGKALSFVTGCLTLIPLFQLTQRLFDRTTARVVGVFFAIYGVHIGLSSVVMSEAPFALFAVWGLDVFFRESLSESPRLRGFLGSAALIAIAGGFRQEAWQLAGILWLFMLWKPRTRRYAIPFIIVALSSFAVWDISNAMADGGWFHALISVGKSKSKEALYHHFSALENILRWTWIFVQSPGPVISVLAGAGLVSAFRRRVGLDLALIAILLIGPYVLLSLVKPQWQPQARYPLFFVLLVLPFAAAATVSLSRRFNLRVVATLIALLSVGSQGVAFHRHSHLFLPVPDYDANDVTAWKAMAVNVQGASAIIVEDVDWRAPGLIAHSGLYDRSNQKVYSWDGPEVLETMLGSAPLPMLLVLHSPLSKWPFLQSAQLRAVYSNDDYQIFRLERRPP